MPISASLPTQTTSLDVTDESIFIRAAGDFAVLVPSKQLMAAGLDGVFADGFPWVLTSAAVDFEANGVQPNQVIRLTAPKANFSGDGDMLVIDAVDGHSVTLRRAYMDLNTGQPPAPSAGLTGVAFSIATFGPQIEEATYSIKRRFGIDDSLVGRMTSDMWDVRELRQAVVLTVLYARYVDANRTDRGDFPKKIEMIGMELRDVLGRIEVFWRDYWGRNQSSSVFNCRITR